MMEAKIVKNKLVVEIDLEDDRLDTAGKGKTLRVASSGGFKGTDCIDPKTKKAITVNLHACVKA